MLFKKLKFLAEIVGLDAIRDALNVDGSRKAGADIPKAFLAIINCRIVEFDLCEIYRACCCDARHLPLSFISFEMSSQACST